MLRLSIFLLCSTVLNMANGFTEIVDTKSGPIRGRVKSTIWYNKPYYSYRGIPYAKPPVGELRFKAPEPVEKWTEIKNAFEYGIWCPQPSKKGKETSEDCLTLNVFVPILEQKKKLPVVFFLPGGSFASGSGSDFIYGPDFMMENEVILVTVNFRLGIFGFLSLGTPEYSGNMGLKDQQLAMKWAYDNIESFGGDNKKITLMGLSVGANSAGFHLLNNESSKCFNQILLLSGAPNKYHNYQKGDHKCLMKELYKKHNNGNPSDKTLIDFLKDVNASEIVNFFQETYVRKYSVWTPVVEKRSSIRPIIVDDPMTALEKTKSINKTAYYTITKYEYLSLFEIGGTDYKDPTAVRNFIKDFNIDLPIFGYKSIIDKKPAYLKNVMKELHNYYFKFNESTPDQELLRQRLMLDSDLYYAYTIEKWMERHVAISKKDTFYHRFSLHTIMNPHPEFPKDFPIAGHAEELPYAFTTTLYFYNAKKVIENKDIDQDHAKAFKAMNMVQKLYTNFIKYGKPIHNDDLMTEEFKPIERSSKADEFDFVDVTNSGLIAGKGLTEGRTKFLDQIIEKVKHLVESHGDVPKKTQIEQLHDMKYPK
ncbi:esterase B1-like [Contarinia nasturtii]|uniref:esterase B1-like n=1 Tax=Contarinia nasturtii TaxID=265458 RepID=UPI0012D4A2E7|nr:esterase B1-like [Contarinia nasturtii]